MKTFEDFDFFSPFSVAEVLTKMAAQTAPGALGSFYGTVTGNQFNLGQDLGYEKDTSDDPVVTGYVVKEGDGCHIFARAQVPGEQMFNAGFGMMALAFFLFLFLKIWWDERGNTFVVKPFELIRLPQLLFEIGIFVVMAYSGRRYIKRFDQKGKVEIIRQFKQFLAA